MDSTALIIGGFALVAILAGVIIALVRRLAKADLNRAVAEAEARHHRALADTRASLEGARTQLQVTTATLATAQGTLLTRERELVEARESIARHEAEAGSLNRRIDELNKLREQMRETFRALSAEALQGNNAQFLQLARMELERAQAEAKTDLEQRQSVIESLVVPIRDSLAANDLKLQEIEKQRIDSFGRLMTEVAGVASASDKLRSETAVLARALHNTNSRGSWGELQLRRACELAGMIEHCDFSIQETVQGQDGALRPDLVVKLPAGRTIVVDAKAPAAAFLEAAACESPEKQQELLESHAAQVKKHVDSLSRKSYWEQFECAPDFVVLFLPNEAFYSAAIQHEPGLLEYAVEQRVLIATPVSLIGLLKVVALGWRQERIAESAQQISDAGRELYDRLRTMTEHFDRVGSSLQKSVEAYNSAVGSMERSVFPHARRFEELGAGGTTPLDEPEPLDVARRSLAAADWVEAMPMMPGQAPRDQLPA